MSLLPGDWWESHLASPAIDSTKPDLVSETVGRLYPLAIGAPQRWHAPHRRNRIQYAAASLRAMADRTSELGKTNVPFTSDCFCLQFRRGCALRRLYNFLDSRQGGAAQWPRPPFLPDWERCCWPLPCTIGGISPPPRSAKRWEPVVCCFSPSGIAQKSQPLSLPTLGIRQTGSAAASLASGGR